MMNRRLLLRFLAAGVGSVTSGCTALLEGLGFENSARTDRAPPPGEEAHITHVLVFKQQRKLQLMHQERAVRVYDISLGFAPEGHKQFEGDGRTPEGPYTIDRRKDDSAYFLSLGISYPNAQDRAFARAQGKDPGGDIFIHGQPPRGSGGAQDWTAGCIALSNDAMAEVYARVSVGTPITIYP